MCKACVLRGMWSTQCVYICSCLLGCSWSLHQLTGPLWSWSFTWFTWWPSLERIALLTPWASLFCMTLSKLFHKLSGRVWESCFCVLLVSKDYLKIKLLLYMGLAQFGYPQSLTHWDLMIQGIHSHPRRKSGDYLSAKSTESCCSVGKLEEDVCY